VDSYDNGLLGVLFDIDALLVKFVVELFSSETIDFDYNFRHIDRVLLGIWHDKKI